MNLLDGGAPFYDTTLCRRRRVAVGALEPQFYAALLEALGMAGDESIANHLDPATWPAIRERFEAKFAERSRDEWHELFADSDCCVAPVLSMREAREDGHNRDRGVFACVGGMPQPAPRRASASPNRTSPRPPSSPAPADFEPPRGDRHRRRSGIGAATLAALAADGGVWSPSIAAPDPRLPYAMASERDLDAVVAAAAKHAGRDDVARAVLADATDRDGARRRGRGRRAWGDVDAFVANAGVIAGGVPAWELPAEQERRAGRGQPAR